MTLIAVAPNGARKTKDDLPSIPLTPEEIAIEASACQRAGAAMIHLHIRDSIGRHSLNTARYQETIKLIKEETDNQLLIQVTSESVGKYSTEEQFEMIHSLKPDAVSIAIREIHNFNEIEINENFNFMKANNTSPQIILYNAHDVSIYKKWLEEGILPGKAYPVLYVIGKSQVEGVFSLDFFDQDYQLPASSWMVCGFGESEFKIGVEAAKRGGHIRIGFENNHVLEDGRIANNNAELVSQMVAHLAEQKRVLATHEEARKTMKPDW